MTLIAWCIGCAEIALAQTPDLETIDGPEATGLVKELDGQLIYPVPVGGILTTLLPSLESKSVRPAGKSPAVSELSGPDGEGRLAVVEHRIGQDFVLRLVGLHGSRSEEIVRRPDLGFKSKAIGRPALSPAGGYVAFVAKTESLHMKVEPKTTFREGTLEVWDAAARRKLVADSKAVDRSLAWLPDGKSLLFSALVGPDVFHPLIDAYGTATGTGGLIPVVDRRVPVVHRMDLPHGKNAPLCIGRRSVASHDGKSILVQGIGFEWMLLDVSSGRLREAKIPGLYDRDRLGVYQGGAIALLDGDLLIYWGLPTTGAVQRKTTNNSPLVGEKTMPSIKVARLTSGEFQTLIPHMDPRHPVEFGQVHSRR
jgi:hypothetical protein